MSKKKRNRDKRPQQRPAPPKWRRITPTKVFIGLLLLFVVVAYAVSAFSGSSGIECPPGQVWSAAHNHCH